MNNYIQILWNWLRGWNKCEKLCHRQQERIVTDMRFDTSNAPEETTKQHHSRTMSFVNVANEWHE